MQLIGLAEIEPSKYENEISQIYEYNIELFIASECLVH